MGNFSFLSDSDLETKLKTAVVNERQILAEVLRLLAEFERRKLYSKTCPSLFEYCTRTLGYSAGAAQRRIDTMRATRLQPAIESKVISGDLNLSTVSRVHSFFRDEARQGRTYSEDEKTILFQQVENKSTREVEKILAKISPRHIPRDQRRVLTEDLTEIRIVLDEHTIQMLEQIKALWSQKYPHLSDSELVKHMAETVLQKVDPAQWKSRENKIELKVETQAASTFPTDRSLLPAPEIKTSRPTAVKRTSEQSKSQASVKKPNRYIPKSTKIEVWKRDRGKCTYPKCLSQFFLQYDHIHPVSFGGETSVENLRLLCFTHHQLVTEQCFGVWGKDTKT